MKKVKEINTYENSIIDNTNSDYSIVVLTDQKEKYIQKFFVNESDDKLIDRCIFMRKIGIPTLK